MTVEENDVYGGAVNFAARVVGAIEQTAEIWLSDQAKRKFGEWRCQAALAIELEAARWYEDEGLQRHLYSMVAGQVKRSRACLQ